MAPKKKSTGKPAASSAVVSSETKADSHHDGEPCKVHLYDAVALKNALDDTAKEVILDAGYQENLMISNIKIILGLLAIAAALYSQFGPGKFPANYWSVATCVVGYLVLSVVLSVYSWKAEGDAFLVTKPRRSLDSGLRMISRMDRFTGELLLLICSNHDPKQEVRTNTNVTKFFHEDGYLASRPFKAVVEELLAKYEGIASSATQKKIQ